MASRNERKRKAKARLAELTLAVGQAFAPKPSLEEDKWVQWAPGDVKGARIVVNALVIRGKVTVKPFAPEIKRQLVLNKYTGKLIERRKSYI